jgi:hypothetical protein
MPLLDPRNPPAPSGQVVVTGIRTLDKKVKHRARGKLQKDDAYYHVRANSQGRFACKPSMVFEPAQRVAQASPLQKK